MGTGKIVLILEKYSDWLEAFSVIQDFPGLSLYCYLIENDRNDLASVKGVFESFVPGDKLHCFTYETRALLLKAVIDISDTITGNDVVAAPFIRYREIWAIIAKLQKQTVTVHLSECLPDTFGHLGYRIGYRGKNLKTWLSLPFFKLYALANKPDRCYFPLYPIFKNPFVKETLATHKPIIKKGKIEFLNDILKNEKRIMLIGGFGYDVSKMAQELGIQKFIATSKHKEIIVDGETIQLQERICAEEIMFGGYVSKIVAYTTSAVVWAKMFCPEIEIDCYEAKQFNVQFGPFYNKYAISSLSKLQITVKPENKNMLHNS